MTPIKRMRPGLGTFVEIGIAADWGISVDSAFARAFDRIALIQSLLSFQDPGSELSQLNTAVGKPIRCHRLSLRCLQLAKVISRASHGLFNCTLGASVVARGALPCPESVSLAECIPAGTEADIVIQGDQVRLARPVLVVLDGIAKGYAIDCAIAELKTAGVRQGWINAGGDIRVFGELVLPIAVRDHRGQTHPIGGLSNAAIATSSSQSSSRYPGLVLGPTGRVLHDRSWSVIARHAWLADALTKVAANLPTDTRAQTLESLGGRWISLDDAVT